MKVETTGDFLILFGDMSEKHGKIFVPDRFDDKIIENVIKFIHNRNESTELIPMAIERYMKLNQGMVTSIRTFVDKFYDHYLVVKDNKEQQDRIMKLMEKTRTRMENDHKLRD